jgi:hypothetical protein
LPFELLEASVFLLEDDVLDLELEDLLFFFELLEAPEDISSLSEECSLLSLSISVESVPTELDESLSPHAETTAKINAKEAKKAHCFFRKKDLILSP